MASHASVKKKTFLTRIEKEVLDSKEDMVKEEQ